MRDVSHGNVDRTLKEGKNNVELDKRLSAPRKKQSMKKKQNKYQQLQQNGFLQNHGQFPTLKMGLHMKLLEVWISMEETAR